MPPIRQNNSLNLGAAPIVTPNIEAKDPFRTLGIIFFVLAVILSASSFGAMKFLQSQNNNIENNIHNIENEVSSMPLDEMLNFYDKTINVNSLLGKHYYITTQLNTLADVVSRNVYFKTMSFVSQTGQNQSMSTIQLSAFASSEADIVRQVDLLKSDKYSNFIKKVELVSIKINKEKGGVDFDIKLDIDPKIKPDYIILGELSKNQEIKLSGTSTATTTNTGTTTVMNSVINSVPVLNNLASSTNNNSSIINNILKN